MFHKKSLYNVNSKSVLYLLNNKHPLMYKLKFHYHKQVNHEKCHKKNLNNVSSKIFLC